MEKGIIAKGMEIGIQLNSIMPAGTKRDIEYGDHTYHFYSFSSSTEFTIDDDSTIYDISEANEATGWNWEDGTPEDGPAKRKAMFDFPEITSTELDLIARIGKRAREMTKGKIVRPQSSWVMDIDAWHRQEPLDLKKLLSFDTFNFMHDIIGIYKHLDRATGEIDRRFMPRSAR